MKVLTCFECAYWFFKEDTNYLEEFDLLETVQDNFKKFGWLTPLDSTDKTDYRGNCDLCEQPIDQHLFTFESAKDPSPGFICKYCSQPSPIGVGYTDFTPGARDKSRDLTSCQCGYSQKAA